MLFPIEEKIMLSDKFPMKNECTTIFLSDQISCNNLQVTAIPFEMKLAVKVSLYLFNTVKVVQLKYQM